MRFDRCGIILNTENYADCVAFYRDTLGLPVLFEKASAAERLTAFDLGGVYLMVEPGGHAAAAKTARDCPAKLRFNTDRIEDEIARLRAAGVAVDHRRHEWGETAELHDPDGNRCALRGTAGFG